MIDENGYYSLRAILGYNCKYNIVLSDRGRGKSFAAKHFLMAQEGTCMCLYRQSTDMHMAMMSWIDPLISRNKDTEKYKVYDPEEFEWEGNDKEGYLLKVDGKPKVWFRYLTQVNHVKQEVFPDDMNWVWLDEFIPLMYKKLPGIESEGDAIRTIVKTIEHDSVMGRVERGLKEVRVLLFANPFTWNNPILSYFKLRPEVGIRKIGPGVVCEMLEPYKSERKGKMTVDEFLGDEVIVNQGWENEMEFVEVMWEKEMEPVFSVRIGKMYFMVYYKIGKRKMYVERTKGHGNTSGMYTYDRWGSLDGLQGEESCIDGSQWLKGMKEKIRKGTMRYRDMNCKFDWMNGIEGLR